MNAIFHESAVPPEWTEFNDLDKRWCTGDDAEFRALAAPSLQLPVESVKRVEVAEPTSKRRAA